MSSVAKGAEHHIGLALGVVATPGVAQTPVLQADVEDVLVTLRSSGVSDREGLVAALQSAWDAGREEEGVRLRNLGVTLSDGEFAGDWQNQAGRAEQRDAFTWIYAVRSASAFELPTRS